MLLIRRCRYDIRRCYAVIDICYDARDRDEYATRQFQRVSMMMPLRQHDMRALRVMRMPCERCHCASASRADGECRAPLLMP